MTILIPKTDQATINKCLDAIEVALEKKFGGKIPVTYKTPLRDADQEAQDKGEAPNPGYAGHYFINVKSNEQPGIIDANRNPVLDAKEFMSGDYCRVSMNAFAYDQKGNKGVSFGLNNIQVVGKGEPLGKARAEDEFDNYDDGEDFG